MWPQVPEQSSALWGKGHGGLLRLLCGVAPGEGRLWDTVWEVGLPLNLSLNPSLLQWLRKPRSRRHIWEELCSLELGTLRQPRAW